MDEAEGFFPERKLVAYRRSLLRADPVPESAARRNTVPWWALLVCLGPSFMSQFYILGESMYRRHSLSPTIVTLTLAGWVLVAGALMAVAFVLWSSRGFRTQQPS
jgi:hypothetical protein